MPNRWGSLKVLGLDWERKIKTAYEKPWWVSVCRNHHKNKKINQIHDFSGWFPLIPQSLLII